jgi:hypothetical protein
MVKGGDAFFMVRFAGPFTTVIVPVVLHTVVPAVTVSVQVKLPAEA